MDHNFTIEITATDGSTVTIDADGLDINVYQKCNGESVRILEMSGQWHNSDPGGHQLNFDVLYVGESKDVTVDDRGTDALCVHSYRSGRGLGKSQRSVFWNSYPRRYG